MLYMLVAMQLLLAFVVVSVALITVPGCYASPVARPYQTGLQVSVHSMHGIVVRL